MPPELQNRQTIAIIGAGPLGRWLALAAARAGFRVLLEDVMPTNLHHAQEYIRRQIGPQYCADRSLAASGASLKGAFHGEVTALTDEMDLKDTPAFSEDTGFLEGANSSPAMPPANATGDLPVAENSLRTVTFCSTIEDAVRQADLVIDCVPDELESKLEILWLLDRMAPPRTVLATPTTRLSIGDLASCTYRPSKCIAIAAEASTLTGNPASAILLRTTPRTTPETVALVESFWRRLGFTPTFELEPTAVQ